MPRKEDEVQEQVFDLKELLPGVVITIFVIFIFFSSFSLQSLQMNPVGSDFLPKIVSILAFVGSVIINIPIVKRLIRNRKRNKNAAVKEKTQQVNLEKVTKNLEMVTKKYSTLITLGLITLYIVTMGLLGFLISTSLYLFVQIMLLAPKEKIKPIIIAIISIVSSLVIYVIFLYAFTIVLPVGILG